MKLLALAFLMNLVSAEALGKPRHKQPDSTEWLRRKFDSLGNHIHEQYPFVSDDRESTGEVILMNFLIAKQGVTGVHANQLALQICRTLYEHALGIQRTVGYDILDSRGRLRQPWTLLRDLRLVIMKRYPVWDADADSNALTGVRAFYGLEVGSLVWLITKDVTLPPPATLPTPSPIPKGITVCSDIPDGGQSCRFVPAP